MRKALLYTRGVWGHTPQENFFLSLGAMRLLLRPFWANKMLLGGKTADKLSVASQLAAA